MTRWMVVSAAALALVACDGEGGGGIFGGGGGGGTTGTDEIPNTATLVQTYEGDLADGSPEDLGFLESNQCVPGTQNEKFNGNWVWFEYEQDAGVQVYVEADPESGVDVSLIVSQAPEGTTGTGASAVTGLCEEGLDYSGSNSGQAESVKVTSINQGYHLVIGVAGAFGETEGTFELNIFEE